MTKIIGWAVGNPHDSPAMYNEREKERAFDAARRWNEPIAALVLHPDVPTTPTVKCSSCGELPVPDYKIALGSTLCIRCSSIVKAPHGHTAIPQWQLVGTKYGNLYRCTLCGITERRESAKSMPQKGLES